ncbi:MAG: VWA domain-containing protein, partial [Bacteroidia bacterium]|nr:VWA domain-containing protein [Bacteroidia bacterium]
LEDGTAVGEGLATAITRLKESETKSKVIILLTDGVNNSGSITPITAGDIAKTFGIRVYTIGVGKRGSAPFTQMSPLGKRTVYREVNIDEESLKAISAATDGKYFRATGNKKLKEIYAEIDKLERTKIEVTEFKNYTEEYLPLALLAGVLLLIELLLRYTFYRVIPV